MINADIGKKLQVDCHQELGRTYMKKSIEFEDAEEKKNILDKGH